MPGNFLFWLIRGRRVEQLTRRIALQLCELTDQPLPDAGTDKQNLLRILQETSALLANLQGQRCKTSVASNNNQSVESTSVARAVQIVPEVPVSEQPEVPLAATGKGWPDEASKSTSRKLSEAPAFAEPVVSLSATNNNQEGVSVTARDLMELSDWVLLAKAGRTAVQPDVLDEVYRQLTKVLATEGITLLDADGPCDYERQMVMGTQVTSDSVLDDHIYSTVRPGYIFHGLLLRPQEVIVYVNENA